MTFYFTGFQRSGTTLCSHLLDAHPSILCADEPEFAKRIFYSQHEKLRDPDNDSIKKNLEFYGVNFSDYLKIVDKLDSGKISIHNFLISCYELMNHKNAPVIGAKEVIDIVSDKFNFIDSLIEIHPPETKYIFIERDIKGVTASFIKMGFFPPGKKRLINFNLVRFAKKYSRIVRHAKSIMPKDQTLFLTFENLIDDPEDTLHQMFNFLNVNSNPKLISKILHNSRIGVRFKYTEINKNIKNNWQKILTEKQIKILNKIK